MYFRCKIAGPPYSLKNCQKFLLALLFVLICPHIQQTIQSHIPGFENQKQHLIHNRTKNRDARTQPIQGHFALKYLLFPGQTIPLSWYLAYRKNTWAKKYENMYCTTCKLNEHYLSYLSFLCKQIMFKNLRQINHEYYFLPEKQRNY